MFKVDLDFYFLQEYFFQYFLKEYLSSHFYAWALSLKFDVGHFKL